MTTRIAFASQADALVGGPSGSSQADAAQAAPASATFVRPSFDQVYATTFPFVWRTARRLGVGDSSRDDVTQEVFVTVYRRLGQFEGRCSIKTWVFSIMMGIVRNYRRTRRRKGAGHAVSASVVDPEVLAALTPDPLEQASRAQAGRIVHQILDELSDEKAVVFVLADLEDMTVPEISELMNTNVNTVYSRLRAARREFNEALARMNERGGNRHD